MADGRLSSITRIERVAILGAAIKEQYQLGPQRSHERPDAHVPLLPLPVAVVASATPTAPVRTGSSIKAVSDFQAIASLLRPQPDLHHRLCYRTNSFIYEERVLSLSSASGTVIAGSRSSSIWLSCGKQE